MSSVDPTPDRNFPRALRRKKDHPASSAGFFLRHRSRFHPHRMWMIRSAGAGWGMPSLVLQTCGQSNRSSSFSIDGGAGSARLRPTPNRQVIKVGFRTQATGINRLEFRVSSFSTNRRHVSKREDLKSLSSLEETRHRQSAGVHRLWMKWGFPSDPIMPGRHHTRWSIALPRDRSS